MTPELGQLRDNGDTNRPWQERMLRYCDEHKTGGTGNSSRKGHGHQPDGSKAKAIHKTPTTTRITRVPVSHSRGKMAATDNREIALPRLYTNQSRLRPFRRLTPLPCVSTRRTTRIITTMHVSLAPSTLVIDAWTVVRHPSGIHF